MILLRQKIYSFSGFLKKIFAPKKQKDKAVESIESEESQKKSRDYFFTGCSKYNKTDGKLVKEIKKIKPKADYTDTTLRYLCWVENSLNTLIEIGNSRFYLFDPEAIIAINKSMPAIGNDLIIIGASIDFSGLLCLGLSGHAVLWQGKSTPAGIMYVWLDESKTVEEILEKIYKLYN